MNYSSADEKEFVDNAITAGTYRIDYLYGKVLKINGSSYEFESTFHQLGVTSKNGERFIVRAIYRAI